MIGTRAYGASGPTALLAPLEIDRRPPGPDEVLVDILYCGVCHSDIHQARAEWGDAIFPMVPGHEIIGTVRDTGSAVARWRTGDTVGVGVFVDSCRECAACRAGEEQYCERGMTATYNGRERDGSRPTYGGYSERITVHQDYVLRIPDGMDLQRAAPLLCAGITTYSPIAHLGVRADDQCAVAGLGGLGHMAVKLLKAFGAHVTVLSHSPGKRHDAGLLGADDFAVTTEDGVLSRYSRHFDLILDAISARHDYTEYLRLLRLNGTMAVVGLPDAPAQVDAMVLADRRRRLVGSVIGGIRETQEMLDFCAARGILADVEVIPIQQINAAFERTLRSDVRYRFVIDIASLRG